MFKEVAQEVLTGPLPSYPQGVGGQDLNGEDWSGLTPHTFASSSYGHLGRSRRGLLITRDRPRDDEGVKLYSSSYYCGQVTF